MYTCRALVKHGVSLVTDSRRENSTLAPPSDAQFGSAATAPACAGDFGFSLVRVRSLLGAMQATGSHGDYELLQWRSAGDWDVSRRKLKNNSLGSAKSGSTGSVSVVRPRSAQISDLENRKVRVLFLSEGNVCRSAYAEVIFNSLVEEHGLLAFVECASKFNASDVLKEVTVYEAIDKEARYTHKVRRLAELCRTRKMEDIDDPLYGNMGGPEELVLLRESYEEIRASCNGLMQTIPEIKASLQDSETLKQGVGKSLGDMESPDWLVPRNVTEGRDCIQLISVLGLHRLCFRQKNVEIAFFQSKIGFRLRIGSSLTVVVYNSSEIDVSLSRNLSRQSIGAAFEVEHDTTVCNIGWNNRKFYNPSSYMIR